ncbi:MAG: prepilin-type cleavage/methylation domain-containing protein [Sideroxydans sp.]|nr:prepilin-type cleavage/methylation domain-containing protein [Sideroxydans sp.]
MKRNQSGFTLIEIAIVLVIIGLLLGGVMKGQELINSAKVKNLAGDFKNIPVYIYGYQDKYRALPGDDANAVSHLGAGAAQAASAVAGNGVIGGYWNSTTTTDESYIFWEHVRRAGLATGSTTPGAADYIPVNAAGGKIGIMSGTTTVASAAMNDGAGTPVAIRGSYVICSQGILGKFVKQLDLQVDDGNTAGGSMMAALGTTYATGAAATTAAVATAAIDDAASYIVCMGI